ncbi:TatD family hydrolase [Geotalea uraniireducens]|uniref:TatD family hydrolase n=1 Tax=Geotalea uraniireducens TaxID=351604 RepID=A0ABN6VME5_9BACT|nr:TatD family hydrolase [Geotalea uraniireducens]BDV41328.1 TatD family hydrolase [Geotalea uraniireducens]
MMIDTHCHLDAPEFHQRLDEVIAAARRAGVERFVIPGVAPGGWDGIRQLARERPFVLPAFGIHPQHAAQAGRRELDRLADLAPSAVAIGEIGLDYLLPDQSRQVQQDIFRAQLRIAGSSARPVLIHCRKAFRDLLAILAEEDGIRCSGVMHSFSGSPEIARDCIAAGLFIAVSGTVTYRNAVRPVEVVRQTPLTRLLLETDAPDLTPEPYRGRLNEPAYLGEIARRVAEIKNVPVEEVTRVTTANAGTLFGFLPR